MMVRADGLPELPQRPEGLVFTCTAVPPKPAELLTRVIDGLKDAPDEAPHPVRATASDETAAAIGEFTVKRTATADLAARFLRGGEHR